jgi:hypothetical protein
MRNLGMSWLDKLEQVHAEMAAQDADPWRLRLERVHGKFDDDGIERITTQTVFDILEIPQRSRGAGACRRLAKLMSQLGWTAVRVRGLTRGGYREQSSRVLPRCPERAPFQQLIEIAVRCDLIWLPQPLAM